MRDRYRAGALLAASLIMALGCGRKIAEREQVEHRIEPCRAYCESAFHPRCGRVDYPPPPAGYHDAEDCAAKCADPEHDEFHWARDAQGDDTCATAWAPFLACLTEATCDEQREYWNASRVDEFPCKAESDAWAKCSAHFYRDEGGQ